MGDRLLDTAHAHKKLLYDSHTGRGFGAKPRDGGWAAPEQYRGFLEALTAALPPGAGLVAREHFDRLGSTLRLWVYQHGSFGLAVTLTADLATDSIIPKIVAKLAVASG